MSSQPLAAEALRARLSDVQRKLQRVASNHPEAHAEISWHLENIGLHDRLVVESAAAPGALQFLELVVKSQEEAASRLETTLST